MRALWVVPSLAWDPGTVIMAWTVPILEAAGVVCDVLPMSAAVEHPMPLAGPQRVLPPPAGGRWTRSLQITGLLRRALGRYDRLVVDQNLDLELKALVAAQGVRRRGRVTMVAHYPLTAYLAARGEHRLGPIRRRIARLYPTVDRVVAVSEAVARDLVARHGIDPAKVFRPPLPLPPPVALDAPRPPGWPFPEDDGVPVIATLGRIEHLKGLEVLVQAVKLLQDRGRRARLLVLGDGPNRGQIERLVRTLGVEAALPGWVADAGAWLQRAAVFVAPQYFDGVGWDIWMAMTAGVPVIATNAPDVSAEILAKGGAGKIVSIGEPLALVEALEHWLVHPDIARRFGVAGLQRARARLRDRVGGPWLDALVK